MAGPLLIVVAPVLLIIVAAPLVIVVAPVLLRAVTAELTVVVKPFILTLGVGEGNKRSPTTTAPGLLNLIRGPVIVVPNVLICNSKYWQGMTKEELRFLKGRPTKVKLKQSMGNTLSRERWTFKNQDDEIEYYYFVGDILKKWKI